LIIFVIISGGVKLANIKSAKKRVEVAERNAARNTAIESRVKTYVKKVDAAVASLRDAEVELSKAASKGVFHKNKVARKVSRMATAVNKIQ
jgi:small subunit ribosomal protein S20